MSLSTVEKLFRLDALYSSGEKRKFTLEELEEELSPDSSGDFKRTLQRYNKFLREHGAPMPARAVNNSYGYDYPWSIRGVQFTEEELIQLSGVAAFLHQFRGFKFNKELQLVLDKIQNQTAHEINELQHFIDFEQAAELRGSHRLGEIASFIRKKLVIDLRYKPFGEEEITKWVHPALLKEYNNRWFLFGYSQQDHRVETYAVDRIESIEVDEQSTYREIDVKSLREKLSQCIGVTVYDNAEIQEVVFDIKTPRSHYIKTKKLHASQQHETLHNGYTRFTLNVYLNRELDATLLQFVPDIQIISPQELKESFYKKLQKSIEKNQSE